MLLMMPGYRNVCDGLFVYGAYIKYVRKTIQLQQLLYIIKLLMKLLIKFSMKLLIKFLNGKNLQNLKKKIKFYNNLNEFIVTEMNNEFHILINRMNILQIYKRI